MSGLRFAMVTTFYPPNHFGGDAIFIRRLTHALARLGHSVDVIHDVDAHAMLHPGPEPAPIEEPEGVTTHPLRSKTSRLSCLATQQLGRPVVHGPRIKQILDEGDFDVVHFHNISLVGGPGVLDYGSGIKLYMAHEHWLVCPSHVLWRHGRELCTGRECFRCVLHHGRPPQYWRYTGLIERKADNIDVFISPSAFSAAKHREFGFTRELEVMPYFLPDDDLGVEKQEDDPADAQPHPYFLFAGRLEKIKGLQDVFACFGSDAPADLVVVGTGDYEAQLKAMAADLPRVRFLGQRTPEQLRQLYRNALAAVVPSVCYETFCIILLEAFRDHTAVIARSLGPLTEIVEKSGGGLLFETEDELRDALHRLAEDGPLRERLAEAGHTALRERWVESVVMRQYLDLVRRVAREKGMSDTLRRLDAACGRSPV
jgi:glycosyltransferase involved in cell wall biosynthesis